MGNTTVQQGTPTYIAYHHHNLSILDENIQILSTGADIVNKTVIPLSYKYVAVSEHTSVVLYNILDHTVTSMMSIPELILAAYRMNDTSVILHASTATDSNITILNLKTRKILFKKQIDGKLGYVFHVGEDLIVYTVVNVYKIYLHDFRKDEPVRVFDLSSCFKSIFKCVQIESVIVVYQEWHDTTMLFIDIETGSIKTKFVPFHVSSNNLLLFNTYSRTIQKAIIIDELGLRNSRHPLCPDLVITQVDKTISLRTFSDDFIADIPLPFRGGNIRHLDATMLSYDLIYFKITATWLSFDYHYSYVYSLKQKTLSSSTNYAYVYPLISNFPPFKNRYGLQQKLLSDKQFIDSIIKFG